MQAFTHTRARARARTHNFQTYIQSLGTPSRSSGNELSYRCFHLDRNFYGTQGLTSRKQNTS